MPKYVWECLITIENAGFEAWCVGGAVRDLIMGLTPSDYDITTNAKPEAIISLFPKTVPTGIQHGTVTVVTLDGNIEVTTYRTEGFYFDHRSPESVSFVENIDEDLKRRDFTVNSICFNPNFGIYDPQNGLADIKIETLRCIGKPQERFTEDALRIMRLFRFSAQLGFSIDNSSLTSALKLSYLLKNISVERIFAELKRAIISKQPESLSPLLTCGALSFLSLGAKEIPPILNQITNDFSLRFAVLCYISNDDAVTILKNLKADNQTTDSVKIYTKLLNSPLPTNKADLKRLLNISSVEYFNVFSNYLFNSGQNVETLSRMLNEITENNEPYLIKHLSLNGNDLIELGYKGQEIGDILNRLLNSCIEQPELNTKENLIKLI